MVESYLQSLGGLEERVAELEDRLKAKSAGVTVGAMSPAIWREERFWGRVVGDRLDGTYEVRRVVAVGRNIFVDDAENVGTVVVGNPAERGGYVGDLTVGEMVAVGFDGLDDQGLAIYHVR